MLIALRQGRVDGLRVTVAVARSLDDSPHDVYLVDVAPAADDGRFDEVPYLECLDPVLEAAGRPSAWVVDVSRTHRSDGDGVGRAHIAVLLATGASASGVAPEVDLTAAVREAFAHLAPPGDTVPLSRDDALRAGSRAVTTAFPDVEESSLSLTDEENHAIEGRWSLGLALGGVARFQVNLGVVPGLPASVHVRRMPASEVVDSVGT
jgi:hypothetical protein